MERKAVLQVEGGDREIVWDCYTMCKVTLSLYYRSEVLVAEILFPSKTAGAPFWTSMKNVSRYNNQF